MLIRMNKEKGLNENVCKINTADVNAKKYPKTSRK
jgi:hypothetical protein